VLALMIIRARLALLMRSILLAAALAFACAHGPNQRRSAGGLVLVTVSHGPGLTTMDLDTVPGRLIVLLVCLWGPKKRRKVLIAAACCLALPVGFASGYYVWSGPEMHGQYQGTPARVGHER
jgi:hypothetical protein